MSEFQAYVGLDVHKDSISVATAEAGRDGEVRHWGVIRNTPEAVARLARKLVELHRAVEFAYEAGPCGYTLYRHLTASGLASAQDALIHEGTRWTRRFGGGGVVTTCPATARPP